MSPMHVVHCLTHSHVGGGQELARTLVTTMRAGHNDVAFTVVLPRGGIYTGRFQELGVPVKEFSFDRLTIGGIVRCAALLRRLQPDVVHTHGKGAGLYVRALPRFLCRARRLHTFHGFHPPAGRLSGLLYRVLERFLMRHTDVLIAVSDSEAADIRRTLGSAAHHVSVIPNSVDRASVLARASAPLEGAAMEFFVVNPGRFVVAMFGRDDPVKNYPLACRVADELCRRREDVAWVFVGAGLDQPRMRELRQRYLGRILVLPETDNPFPILARSSVLCMPSRKEGAPLSLLESFALGKPVVGTNVPGISDLVRDGWNGLLCQETPEDLAAALDLVAGDAALYRRLSENARATGEQVDIRAWAERYYRIYRGD